MHARFALVEKYKHNNIDSCIFGCYLKKTKVDLKSISWILYNLGDSFSND